MAAASGGYLVEICHDGLFVGNRDVQPVKRAGFQKRLQFFRLFFIEFVFIGRPVPGESEGNSCDRASWPSSPRSSILDHLAVASEIRELLADAGKLCHKLQKVGE